MAGYYELLRALKANTSYQRVRRSLLDPTHEREEWRRHFEAIQHGTGTTSAEIWDKVAARPVEDQQMGAVPTNEKCLCPPTKKFGET